VQVAWYVAVFSFRLDTCLYILRIGSSCCALAVGLWISCDLEASLFPSHTLEGNGLPKEPITKNIRNPFPLLNEPRTAKFWCTRQLRSKFVNFFHSTASRGRRSDSCPLDRRLVVRRSSGSSLFNSGSILLLWWPIKSKVFDTSLSLIFRGLNRKWV
jgi:hypothetical protein